jgi:D-glycero-beta-D-manno-heptose 1-phosphate adenylyltransferase
MRVEPPRVLSAADAEAWAARARQTGKRVVFTNGVFDLVHPGHVRYLREARALGDALVVAINSDRSVRANRGPGRPINQAEERGEVLAALAFVDAVVVFDEDTPFEIIRRLQPDILVKGADWAHDSIVGRDIVEGRGGVVVRMELAPGFSTTGIIDKIRGGS